MIASAMKSPSVHDFQHPSIISYIIFLRLPISPLWRVSRLGIRDGLRTIYYYRVSDWLDLSRKGNNLLYTVRQGVTIDSITGGGEIQT